MGRLELPIEQFSQSREALIEKLMELFSPLTELIGSMTGEEGLQSPIPEGIKGAFQRGAEALPEDLGADLDFFPDLPGVGFVDDVFKGVKTGRKAKNVLEFPTRKGTGGKGTGKLTGTMKELRPSHLRKKELERRKKAKGKPTVSNDLIPLDATRKKGAGKLPDNTVDDKFAELKETFKTSSDPDFDVQSARKQLNDLVDELHERDVPEFVKVQDKRNLEKLEDILNDPEIGSLGAFDVEAIEGMQRAIEILGEDGITQLLRFTEQSSEGINFLERSVKSTLGVSSDIAKVIAEDLENWIKQGL